MVLLCVIIEKTTTNNHLKAKIQLGETFTEATFSIHEDKYKEKKKWKSRVMYKNPTDLSFKPTPRCLLSFFQDELEARISLKAFFL